MNFKSKSSILNMKTTFVHTLRWTPAGASHVCVCVCDRCPDCSGVRQGSWSAEAGTLSPHVLRFRGLKVTWPHNAGSLYSISNTQLERTWHLHTQYTTSRMHTHTHTHTLSKRSLSLSYAKIFSEQIFTLGYFTPKKFNSVISNVWFFFVE